MKVLFITRKYPPSVGGMENYLFDLIANYPSDKIVLSYGGNQKYLPFVLIYFFVKSFLVLSKDSKNFIIHCGDGVLSPLAFLLKKIFGCKVVMTAYGKDIIFNRFYYHKLIPFFLKRMDKIVCISNDVLNECINAGVLKQNLLFIPCGIVPEKYSFTEYSSAHSSIQKILKLETNNCLLLLTLGRLCERKGQLWFVENVVPLLPPQYIYIIAGPEDSEISGLRSLLGIKKLRIADQIKAAIEKNNLSNRVFLLGKIDFKYLCLLLSAADLFIMPNHRVAGDKEGFGLVNIEAGLAGTPAIGSRIEGIKDSIIHEVTGCLVEENNVPVYLKAIEKYSKKKLTEGARIKQAVIENYSWKIIANKYLNVFLETYSKN